MDAASLDERIMALAATNGGVLTRPDLLAIGASTDQISSRIGRLLTRYADGVFVVGPLLDHHLDLAAARAVPGGLLSFETAAALHQLPVRRVEATHVSSSRRTRRQLTGVVIHTTKWLPDADRTVVDQRPVTTEERTICDLASRSSARWLRQVMETAITRQSVTVESLQACILSFRRKGRTGSRLLGLLDTEMFDGEPMPMSALERRAEELLRQQRFPPWVRQFQPPWYDGLRGIVDLAWPDEQVVLELDGRRWHSMTAAFDDDRRRDQLALAAGWITVRASWQQVTKRPEEFLAALRAALAHRSVSHVAVERRNM